MGELCAPPTAVGGAARHRSCSAPAHRGVKRAHRTGKKKVYTLLCLEALRFYPIIRKKKVFTLLNCVQ